MSREKVSATGSVSVGWLDRTVCIKVDGRATFQSSGGLKEFIKKMIHRGHRDFVVDLGNCELMDSTFMGTLAGAALRLRELAHGGLRVVRANTRNRDLLCGLGLDQIFDVSTGGIGEPMPETRPVAPADQDRDAQRETMLLAHEALARADAANAVKFRDVIEFLRQDTGEGASES
jgi:anti-sigma B factor antagonist